MTPLQSNAHAQLLSEQALALHRAGDLVQAERLYQKALAAQPDHFIASHSLGILRADTKRRSRPTKM